MSDFHHLKINTNTTGGPFSTMVRCSIVDGAARGDEGRAVTLGGVGGVVRFVVGCFCLANMAAGEL